MIQNLPKVAFCLACLLGPMVLEAHAIRTPDASIGPVSALVIRIVAACFCFAALSWWVSIEVRRGMHHRTPGMAQKTALGKATFCLCVIVPWILSAENARSLLGIGFRDAFAARMIGLVVWAVLATIGVKLIDRHLRRRAAAALPQWRSELGTNR